MVNRGYIAKSAFKNKENNMQSGSFSKRRKTFSYTTRSSFLERVKAGNEEAWKEFYSKYVGMIHFIGKKRQLTPEECDDLMVDVMMIFWRKMDSFFYDPKRGKFRSYLGKIANLSAFRIFNRNHKQNSVNVPFPEEYPEEYPEDIDWNYMKEWQDFLLEKALEELKNEVDTEIWQTFYMSTIQQRPIEEVAAVTRKSPNNIYVIRSRCLKKLRSIIAAYRELGENELAGNSPKNN